MSYRFPDRPQNHAPTLPFHTLHKDLFRPLIEVSSKTGQSLPNRRKLGPKSVNSQNPHELRRAIIERYISRWRSEVGNDFYPAMRLILPDKDRDRAMYGLKEKVLARYFVKILKIDKNSDDGQSLLNWKLPSRGLDARRAGDFPGRVHQVFVKRPSRIEPGNMTIEEVNILLNRLSATGREEDQLPIIEQFYRQMNPDELKWLVGIILRTMHIGATERTFLKIWHPDSDALFNVSSSLKRVCWQLWNPSIRLEQEHCDMKIGECFQPQLAQFQPRKLNAIVAKMLTTEEDPVFWIEEKLDGERMQLHMQTETDGKTGITSKVFKFWSRKAKDYTYLYGSSFNDDSSALTQHLRTAFADGVENIILDGEMITWDPNTDKMVPFGTLKTAALEQQRNPFATGPRPLLRVFDILYLNGQNLTRYTLRDRRKALDASVNPVPRRLEILEYTIGWNWDDIETALRKVVAEASEGLVVKNPRSAYRLNDRNDDWVKVKPEYMEEFGESLDCLVVGGYYGSGKRGGGLSSFMCGLRVDNTTHKNEKSHKFLSFFKVGGGLTANDYANIRHHTEGKWIDWDPKNPPTEYIELGGGTQFQRERPDVWIKPEDSVVIQAKAASVGPSDEFAVNLTLRFPRFQRLRSDKDWTTALSLQELLEIRDAAEQQREANKKEQVKQDQMKAEQRKRHQRLDIRNRPLQVAGYTQRSINEMVARSGTDTEAHTTVFRGLTFYVLTESSKPVKKSKLELEEMIKEHGGQIIQTADPPARENGLKREVVCIASRRNVKVASLMKRDEITIFAPTWLFDCISQAQIDSLQGLQEAVLHPELERHVFFAPEEQKEIYEMEVDHFGDSYARDTSVEELRQCLASMEPTSTASLNGTEKIIDFVGEAPGWLFRNTVLYLGEHDGVPENLNIGVQQAQKIARFAGAKISRDLNDESVTHVVLVSAANQEKLSEIRRRVSNKTRLPRIVTTDWILQSWAAKTRLDEERFAPV